MKSSVRRFLLACSLALLSGAANATVVQVANPAGLTQGSYALEDFEDDAFVSGAMFVAPSGVRRLPASSASSGVTSSGHYALTSNNFPESLTVVLASPASSVGMFFGNDDRCCTAAFTAYLDIFGASGSLGTISVVANMNDYVDQFIGFTSNELVTSVSLRYGTGDVGLYHFIDDVRFNVAAVPEPGTLALLGVGALGFVALRRKNT